MDFSLLANTWNSYQGVSPYYDILLGGNTYVSHISMISGGYPLYILEQQGLYHNLGLFANNPWKPSASPNPGYYF